MDAGTPADGFVARWSRRKLDARRDAAAPPAATAASPLATPLAPDAPPLPALCAAPIADAADDAALRTPPAPAIVARPGAAPPSPPDDDCAAAQTPPPPTLADVAALTPDSDFSRFVARDVDSEVRNAALKKLFAAPHFQVMDGLDVYIDDYSRPDPLPRAVLRRMAQAAALGLVDAPPEDDGRGAGRDVPHAGATDRAESAAPPASRDAAPIDEADATAAPAARGRNAEAPADEDADLRLQPHDAARCAGAAARAGADDAGQS